MPANRVGSALTSSRSFAAILRRLWPNLDVHSTAALMVVAIMVGLGTGLTAVLFIKAIGWITQFSFDQGIPQLLAPLGGAWIVLVPILGSLISGPIIAFWAIER